MFEMLNNAETIHDWKKNKTKNMSKRRDKRKENVLVPAKTLVNSKVS